METNRIKDIVRSQYGSIARQGGGCGCGCNDPATQSSRLGYSAEELQLIPDQANLGLGCGNPTAVASLQPGETVLDLGSGAGMDCFLAAARVGPTGTVIGVDMTPEMVEKARRNAEQVGANTIDFRLGEIEALPVDERSIDVVISNCVINLVPDKASAFREILRVLRPGGRLMISDIALNGELPAALLASAEAYVGCISGAAQITEYQTILAECGFTDVAITANPINLIADWLAAPQTASQLEQWQISSEDAKAAAQRIVSVMIQAYRPR